MDAQRKIKTPASSPVPEKRKKKDKEVVDKCVLCPSFKGPFLSTQDGKLVHKLCAEMIPETCIEDEEFVTGVDDIHPDRWAFSCSVCRKKGIKYGACIQCEECANSVHATCAYKEGLLVHTGHVLKFYCIKHNIAKQEEKSKRKEKKLMDLGKTFLKGTLVSCHWYAII